MFFMSSKVPPAFAPFESVMGRGTADMLLLRLLLLLASSQLLSSVAAPQTSSPHLASVKVEPHFEAVAMTMSVSAMTVAGGGGGGRRMRRKLRRHGGVGGSVVLFIGDGGTSGIPAGLGWISLSVIFMRKGVLLMRPHCVTIVIITPIADHAVTIVVSSLVVQPWTAAAFDANLAAIQRVEGRALTAGVGEPRRCRRWSGNS